MPTLKYDRDNLVNLIAERATFERAAVTLYDTLLGAIDDIDHPLLVSSMDALARHRKEEQEHAEWVEDLLGRLGGRAQRDLPEAVTRESRTLVDIIRRARASGSVFTMFHAMLSSELMDAEGWKLLLEVADDLDDARAVAELGRFVDREDEHLALVRHVLLSLAKESVVFTPMVESGAEVETTRLIASGDGRSQERASASMRAGSRRGPGTARARAGGRSHNGGSSRRQFGHQR